MDWDRKGDMVGNMKVIQKYGIAWQEELEGDFDELEEDEYDALNDETFGASSANEEGDWEDTHTLLAAATESTRARDQPLVDGDSDLEKSLCRLVLADDEKYPSNGRSPNRFEGLRPAFPMQPSAFEEVVQMPFSRPPMSRIPTVEELERQMLEGKVKNTGSSSPRPTQPSPLSRIIRPPLTNMSTPPNHRPMATQTGFPPPPPGMTPPYKMPNHHPYPNIPNIPSPYNVGMKPPGFPSHPINHMGLDPRTKQPMVRNNYNQPMGGKPLMGMYPGQGPMHPHMAQELMMRRAGLPLMMPGMPPMMSPLMPQPPPGMMMDPKRMFPPLLNPQMRPDLVYGYDNGRNNFHPPHPILYPQGNHQKMQQQNNLNWQQRQLYNRNSSNNSDRDEYAKLMGNRERYWLLNLQMLQLATDKPHVDDYYYTMWKKQNPTPKKPDPLKNGYHKPEKRSDAFFANNRPNENHRERRDSESTTATSSSPRVYVPLQFENSLGKIQCKSVIAPRVVFDIAVVSDSQSSNPQGPAVKDHRKTKKILLELERLYLLLMEAEEADNPDFQVDAAKDDDEEVEPKPSKADLINRVLVGFLNDERYLSFLCIHKGKRLLLRCLNHVTSWEPPMFIDLWSRLFKAFPTVLRRDKDDSLLSKFYPFLKEWTQEVSWSSLMVVAKSLLSGTRDGRTSVLRASPSPSKPVLNYVLSNKFGVSAVSQIVQQGEALTLNLSDEDINEWKTFIEELVKSMAGLDFLDNVVQPFEPISHNDLTAILNRHCRHQSSHLHGMALKILGS